VFSSYTVHIWSSVNGQYEVCNERWSFNSQQIIFLKIGAEISETDSRFEHPEEIPETGASVAGSMVAPALVL
jgi:hypothetical protein